MEDDGGTMAVQVGENMAPAIVCTHPRGSSVVVAIGAGLRIFDFVKNVPVAVEDKTTPGCHAEAIRAIAFNNGGSFFASAGDDKLVKLWDAESWSCLKTTRLPKKVTSVTFSKDSNWVLFADKFGAVYTLTTTAVKDHKDEPVQLLAHCCSIITDMEISADGKFIVTSDRDFKIRVSIFPSDPLKGAPEIWSYCLGHTSFVTCTAFVGEQSSGNVLLISGSGDSTVRLWDYTNGKMHDTYDTADLKGVINGKSEENSTPAVIALSVSPDGSIVAVLIERFSGVLLLQYDPVVKKLKYFQRVSLSEQVSPTSLAFDVDSRLWLVAGAAESLELGDQLVTPEEAAGAEARAQMIAKTAIAHVRVITKRTSPAEDASLVTVPTYGVCEEEAIPGGNSLLLALQGNRADTGEVAVAAEAAEQAMRKLMSKRQYSIEQRENRKRFRNDKKLENKEL